MDLLFVQSRITHEILHLFYHRNKNQHRHSHWWKWLSMLKRCVKKLREEVVGKELSHLHARIIYMKDILLPKCYESFTQLVQDNQFAALGLALVAELAKIRKTISSYADAERGTADDPAEITTAEKLSAAGPAEDFGEVVDRSGDLNVTVLDSATPSISELPSRSNQVGASQRLSDSDGDGTDLLDGIHRAQRSVKRLLGSEAGLPLLAPLKEQKKTPKTKANPIDDLFDGLG